MFSDLNGTLFTSLNNLAFQSEFFDTLIYFSAEFLWLWMLFFVLVPIGIYLVKRYVMREGYHTLHIWRSLARDMLFVLVATACAVIVSTLIKEFFPSPRPTEALSTARHLVAYEGFKSFPSGHTTFVMAVAVSVFLSHRRVGLLFLAMACVAALSRIIAGVHWPVDILGGVLIGVVVPTTLWALRRAWRDKRPLHR